MEALFADKDDTSMAEGFRDKVRALHEHFDRDKDGFLDHSELRGLQLLTSGNDMSQGQVSITDYACLQALLHH